MIAAGAQTSGARRAVLIAVAFGLAHFVAAAGSLMMTRWSNGLASIWLPNALLITFLLLTPRSRWVPVCAAVMVSGSLANWIGGAPLPLAMLFGTTNWLEPVVIALLVNAGARSVNLERIGDLVRFVLAALLCTAASATIAAGAGALFYGESFDGVWSSWFSSSFLGLAILTPLLLIGCRQFRSPRLTREELVEAFSVLGLVAAAGALVFSQTRWPLFFLLQPPVLIATFRMRALGAATSVLILAAIGTAAAIMGTGPMSLIASDFSERLILLQAFLAVAILTAMPIAAMLTERDRMSLSLADQETQLASIVDAVNDVIFRTDRAGTWTYLNPAWEKLTGHAVEESIGHGVLEHVIPEDRPELTERYEALTSGALDAIRQQFRFRTAAGDFRWGEVQAQRLRGVDGDMIGSAGIIVDISDRLALAALADDARRRAERDAEAALLLAATDELTGLASRRAFMTVLDQQLSHGQPLAIALFDIDHFKKVNDQHGHGVGDTVLRNIAALAESVIRDHDMVGRIGGEEFAVLMPGASLEQAAAIGERLRIVCAEAVHPPGVRATVSLGVAAAMPGIGSAALLAEADTALYRAKFEGRNCLRMAA